MEGVDAGKELPMEVYILTHKACSGSQSHFTLCLERVSCQSMVSMSEGYLESPGIGSPPMHKLWHNLSSNQGMNQV